LDTHPTNPSPRHLDSLGSAADPSWTDVEWCREELTWDYVLHDCTSENAFMILYLSTEYSDLGLGAMGYVSSAVA